MGQVIAFNDAAAAVARGVPARAGTSDGSPQPAGESCSSCDAGQSGKVFDSCHLGNACGDECCDACPTWCVRAGAVFLQRPTDTSRALVTAPPPASSSALLPPSRRWEPRSSRSPWGSVRIST